MLQEEEEEEDDRHEDELLHTTVLVKVTPVYEFTCKSLGSTRKNSKPTLVNLEAMNIEEGLLSQGPSKRGIMNQYDGLMSGLTRN